MFQPLVWKCTYWPYLDLDLWTLKQYHFIGIPRSFPISSLNTFGTFVFELCCGQTDKQTDRQTDSKILPTSTDILYTLFIAVFYLFKTHFRRFFVIVDSSSLLYSCLIGFDWLVDSDRTRIDQDNDHGVGGTSDAWPLLGLAMGSPVQSLSIDEMPCKMRTSANCRVASAARNW